MRAAPGNGHGTVHLSQRCQSKDATASRWLWEAERDGVGVKHMVLSCGVGLGHAQTWFRWLLHPCSPLLMIIYRHCFPFASAVSRISDPIPRFKPKLIKRSCFTKQRSHPNQMSGWLIAFRVKSGLWFPWDQAWFPHLLPPLFGYVPSC